MNLPLVLLVATGTLGAFDVLYYHLYRFRLFARRGSAAEEATHLIRHLTFLGILALLASGVQSAAADRVLLVLFAVDLVNSTADILLEPAGFPEKSWPRMAKARRHAVGTAGCGFVSISLGGFGPTRDFGRAADWKMPEPGRNAPRQHADRHRRQNDEKHRRFE